MTHHKPPCERNKWNRCPTQNSQTKIVSPTKSWQWNCYSLNFISETLHGNFRLSSFGKAQVFCCTRYDVEWIIPGRIPHECCRKSGKMIQFPNASPIFPQDVKQHGHNSRYEQRLVLKISNIHAQTLEHGGEGGKWSTPVSTLHYVLTSFLHQTRRGFTWCLFPPGVRVYPGRLVRITRLFPDPLINLPLAKTEPTRKKKKKYKILVLSVFSRPPLMSLCDHPKLSDWPRTLPGATNIDWCAVLEQEAKPDSLLSNVNWNFHHCDHSCHFKVVTGHFHSKRFLPMNMM